MTAFLHTEYRRPAALALALLVIVMVSGSLLKTSPAKDNADLSLRIIQLPSGNPLIAELNKKCQFQIIFGRYSPGGIEKKVYEQVSSFMVGDLGVSEIIMWASGKEGERTICIKPASPAHGERLYAAIKKLIPVQSTKACCAVVYGQQSFRTTLPK